MTTRICRSTCARLTKISLQRYGLQEKNWHHGM
ncbi:hypothetical protein Gotur_000802 [Gossypium turneri]